MREAVHQESIPPSVSGPPLVRSCFSIACDPLLGSAALLELVWRLVPKHVFCGRQQRKMNVGLHLALSTCSSPILCGKVAG